MQRLLSFAHYLLSLFTKPLAEFLSKLAVLKSSIAEKIRDKITPEAEAKSATLSSQLIKEEEAAELQRFELLTEDEALKRFQIYQGKDPLPDIAPALLNSADISDYVAATGMLWPFHPKKLKPASYEIAFLGKCVYWDEDGEKRVRIVQRDEEFVLRRNSIAFVTLEPMFRIPDYIALRFNLKITHIYRGILLGTGPLVDPGFLGKLSVPLHNLTNNDYTLVGGEDLIWMEFTKVSKNQRWLWTGTQAPQEGLYHPFPINKNLRDVESYLRKADPHRPIRSSIPEVVKKSAQQAQEAVSSVRFFTGLSIFAVVTIGVALISYFNTNTSYLRDSQETLQAVRLEVEKEKERSDKMQTDLDDLRRQLQAIESKNKNQQAEK